MRCIALLSLVSGVFLLSGGSRVLAQTNSLEDGDGGLNLFEIVDLIQTDNHELRAESLHAQAVRAGANRFGSLPDPAISVSVQPFPVLSARGSLRSQWSVTQSIPYPGERNLRSGLAQADGQVATEKVGVVRNQLILDAKIAYYQLLTVRERLLLADEFEKHLDDFEQSASTLYEVGSGSQHAILKAQIQRSQLDHVRLELESIASVAIQEIARLVSSRSMPIRIEQLDFVSIRSDSLSIDSLVMFALAHRPDIKVLQAATRKAETRSTLVQRENMPDFMAGISYIDVSKSELLSTANGRDAFGIMAGIRIPLWSKPKRARLEEAALDRASVRHKLLEAHSVIETRTADLVKQLQLIEQKIDLFANDLIPKAGFSFDATVAAYTTGRTDFLDLLDSERTLYDLSNSLTLTHYQRRVLIARLEHTLGLTWLSDLPLAFSYHPGTDNEK